MEKEKTSISYQTGKVVAESQMLRKLFDLQEQYQLDGDLDAVAVLDEAIKLIPIKEQA